MPYFMLKDREPLYPLSPYESSTAESTSSEESIKICDDESPQNDQIEPMTEAISNDETMDNREHGSNVKKTCRKRAVKQVKSSRKKPAIKRKRDVYEESSDDEWHPPGMKGSNSSSSRFY